MGISLTNSSRRTGLLISLHAYFIANIVMENIVRSLTHSSKRTLNSEKNILLYLSTQISSPIGGEWGTSRGSKLTRASKTH